MRRPQHLRAWLRGQPDWVFDGAIALCAVGLKLSLLAGAPGDAPFRASQAATVAAVVLSLTGAGALIWRRRAPGPVLVVVALCSVAGVALGVPRTGFTLVVALYSVAAYAPRRESLAGLAVFSVLTAISLVLANAVEFAAVNALVFVSAWVLGDQRRIQRERTAMLERRAGHLELQRAAQSRLAAAEERERIAAELHDVLAHSVAAMVTQGVAAERWIAADAERASAALLEVERTGRRSLVDLRRLLGLLRERAGGAALAPQPDLDDVPGLVAHFRDRGLPVRLVMSVDARPPPAVVSLSAYRILQAALDNVLVHAGRVPTTVTLDSAGPELVLEVVDRGPGGKAPAVGAVPAQPGGRAGAGLAGMRERAALAGGTVDAGLVPGGGFAVRARLPVAERVQ